MIIIIFLYVLIFETTEMKDIGNFFFMTVSLSGVFKKLFESSLYIVSLINLQNQKLCQKFNLFQSNTSDKMHFFEILLPCTWNP